MKEKLTLNQYLTLVRQRAQTRLGLYPIADSEWNIYKRIIKKNYAVGATLEQSVHFVLHTPFTKI